MVPVCSSVESYQLKPKVGAPPVPTALPFVSTSCALPWTWPWASLTPSTLLDRATQVLREQRADVVALVAVVTLSPRTSTATFWLMVVNRSSKTLPRLSVRTNAPATNETPRTIDREDRSSRSLRAVEAA